MDLAGAQRGIEPVRAAPGLKEPAHAPRHELTPGDFMLRSAVIVLCLLPTLGLADDAAIRRALEPKLGGAKIEGIQPAPIAGLFEVRFRSAEGLRVVYTDAQGSYVVQGNIFE